MCLICFLTNKNQYLLRHSAAIRTDRFEHTIDAYKDEFINNFINNKGLLCNEHQKRDESKYIISALEEIEIKDINSFFETLKNIYIDWINANIKQAINEFKNVIKDYELDIFSEKLSLKLLYRGRFSTTFISHWDMFHIPFNKRYLIRNQRYSLGGQPILYFATSPYGVYKELGSHNNLRISRFKINKGQSFNIFENINHFEKYINNDNIESILVLEELSDKKYIKGMFYLMILASCCSFSRREDTVDKEFSEEYILPQILTIVLKELKYNGILYISTKAYNDKNNKNIKGKMFDILYSNYCIFTNYNINDSLDKTCVYDRKLYKKFDISNVISYNKAIENDLYNINEIDNLLIKIDELTYTDCYAKDIAYILAEEVNIIKEINNLIKDTEKNEESECMKLKKSNYADCYEKDIAYILAEEVNIIKEISNFIQDEEKNKESECMRLKKLINMHIIFIRDILLNIEAEGRADDGKEKV